MQSMSPNQQCLNANHIDLARCYQSQNNPSYQTMSTCPYMWTQLKSQEHSIKLD